MQLKSLKQSLLIGVASAVLLSAIPQIANATNGLDEFFADKKNIASVKLGTAKSAPQVKGWITWDNINEHTRLKAKGQRAKSLDVDDVPDAENAIVEEVKDLCVAFIKVALQEGEDYEDSLRTLHTKMSEYASERDFEYDDIRPLLINTLFYTDKKTTDTVYLFADHEKITGSIFNSYALPNKMYGFTRGYLRDSGVNFDAPQKGGAKTVQRDDESSESSDASQKKQTRSTRRSTIAQSPSTKSTPVKGRGSASTPKSQGTPTKRVAKRTPKNVVPSTPVIDPTEQLRQQQALRIQQARQAATRVGDDLVAYIDQLPVQEDVSTVQKASASFKGKVLPGVDQQATNNAAALFGKIIDTLNQQGTDLSQTAPSIQPILDLYNGDQGNGLIELKKIAALYGIDGSFDDDSARVFSTTALQALQQFNDDEKAEKKRVKAQRKIAKIGQDVIDYIDQLPGQVDAETIQNAEAAFKANAQGQDAQATDRAAVLFGRIADTLKQNNDDFAHTIANVQPVLDLYDQDAVNGLVQLKRIAALYGIDGSFDDASAVIFKDSFAAALAQFDREEAQRAQHALQLQQAALAKIGQDVIDYIGQLPQQRVQATIQNTEAAFKANAQGHTTPKNRAAVLFGRIIDTLKQNGQDLTQTVRTIQPILDLYDRDEDEGLVQLKRVAALYGLDGTFNKAAAAIFKDYFDDALTQFIQEETQRVQQVLLRQQAAIAKIGKDVIDYIGGLPMQADAETIQNAEVAFKAKAQGQDAQATHRAAVLFSQIVDTLKQNGDDFTQTIANVRDILDLYHRDAVNGLVQLKRVAALYGVDGTFDDASAVIFKDSFGAALTQFDREEAQRAQHALQQQQAARVLLQETQNTTQNGDRLINLSLVVAGQQAPVHSFTGEDYAAAFKAAVEALHVAPDAEDVRQAKALFVAYGNFLAANGIAVNDADLNRRLTRVLQLAPANNHLKVDLINRFAQHIGVQALSANAVALFCNEALNALNALNPTKTQRSDDVIAALQNHIDPQGLQVPDKSIRKPVAAYFKKIAGQGLNAGHLDEAAKAFGKIIALMNANDALSQDTSRAIDQLLSLYKYDEELAFRTLDELYNALTNDNLSDDASTIILDVLDNDGLGKVNSARQIAHNAVLYNDLYANFQQELDLTAVGHVDPQLGAAITAVLDEEAIPQPSEAHVEQFMHELISCLVARGNVAFATAEDLVKIQLALHPLKEDFKKLHTIDPELTKSLVDQMAQDLGVGVISNETNAVLQQLFMKTDQSLSLVHDLTKSTLDDHLDLTHGKPVPQEVTEKAKKSAAKALAKSQVALDQAQTKEVEDALTAYHHAAYEKHNIDGTQEGSEAELKRHLKTEVRKLKALKTKEPKLASLHIQQVAQALGVPVTSDEVSETIQQSLFDQFKSEDVVPSRQTQVVKGTDGDFYQYINGSVESDSSTIYVKEGGVTEWEGYNYTVHNGKIFRTHVSGGFPHEWTPSMTTFTIKTYK